MRRATACLALLWALLTMSAGARAQARDEARPNDLARLQEDVANLDETLQSLDPADPSSRAFRERAEEIRENVIYLKVKMRRNQAAGGQGTGVLYDEVADVRHGIAQLRGDLDAAVGSREREPLLDEGTEIAVRLDEALSSKLARREDRVEGSVTTPVRAGGVLAIPAGSRVRGIVRNVQPAERPSKGGRLELEFDSLYVDDRRLDIRGSVAAIRDEHHNRDTAGKAGIGAVLGGVIGGLFGGGKGVAIGAIVGAGGAVVGTKGDDVELPAGTVLTVRLERPLTIARR